MEFFILDRQLLFRSRFILQGPRETDRGVSLASKCQFPDKSKPSSNTTAGPCCNWYNRNKSSRL